MSSLWEAARDGDLGQVTNLVEVVGVNVDEEGGNNKKKSPISWAALGGHLDVVRYLAGKRAKLGRGSGYRPDSPLCCACRNGHLNIVQYLLEKDVWVEEEGEDEEGDNNSPICWAALNGHLEIVKCLRQKGALLNGNGYYLSNNPLSCASKKGHLNIVRYLVENGADIDQSQWSKELGSMTPLCWATLNGHVEIVRFLSDNNADLRGKGLFYCFPPICCAAKGGHIEIVQFLFGKGIDVNGEGGADGTDNDKMKTPVCWAALGGHLEVVKFLVDEGARLSRRGFFLNDTPLCCASRNDHSAVVSYLLGPKVDIDEKGCEARKRRTPLSWAISNGHTATVDILIAHGARINLRAEPQQEELGPGRVEHEGDFKPLAPLSMAAVKGHANTAVRLLNHGADLSAVSGRHDALPLWYAALHGHPAVTSQLLIRGAWQHVNHVGGDRGWTPLLAAVAGDNRQSDHDRQAVVRLLLERHADFNARDRHRKTALMHAVSAHPPRALALVKLLIDRGAGLDLQDSRGRTALHLAVRRSKGSSDIGVQIREDQAQLVSYRQFVYLLRDRGADVNILDVCGKTPFDYDNDNNNNNNNNEGS